MGLELCKKNKSSKFIFPDGKEPIIVLTYGEYGNDHHSWKNVHIKSARWVAQSNAHRTIATVHRKQRQPGENGKRL